MLMPLRASQDPSGRRSSLPFMSPKGMAPGRRSSLLLSPLQGMELLAPHKSLSSFFNRIPSERAVAFGSVPAFPAEEASVARTRSLESTFGWARPGEYALRREVAVPERPAGSLEPLRERRSSLGRSRPLGFLRKSTRAEFAVRAPSTLRFISLLGSPRCGQAFVRGTDEPRGRFEGKQARVVRTMQSMADAPCAQGLLGGPRVEPRRQVCPHVSPCTHHQVLLCVPKLCFALCVALVSPCPENALSLFISCTSLPPFTNSAPRSIHSGAPPSIHLLFLLTQPCFPLIDGVISAGDGWQLDDSNRCTILRSHQQVCLQPIQGQRVSSRGQRPIHLPHFISCPVQLPARIVLNGGG